MFVVAAAALRLSLACAVAWHATAQTDPPSERPPSSPGAGAEGVGGAGVDGASVGVAPVGVASVGIARVGVARVGVASVRVASAGAVPGSVGRVGAEGAGSLHAVVACVEAERGGADRVAAQGFGAAHGVVARVAAERVRVGSVDAEDVGAAHGVVACVGAQGSEAERAESRRAGVEVDGRAQDPVARAVDAWIDARHDGPLHAPRASTDALLAELRELGVESPTELEAALRAPRHAYPSADALVGRTTEHTIDCYHVDYSTRYFLFVPKGYTPDRPHPLVFVAHGGNSSMSPERAGRVARSYLSAYATAMAEHLDAVVVAPASSRGWGQIGNSLALSVISDLQRRLAIDPDRIYVTGQSMGGHMAFRAALTLGDRFAAVSPQSGGYDFVEKRSIANLLTVPGYVTWGKREPYGIDRDSRTNAAWAREHDLDWVFVEKDGGHTIYQDELPAVARFFAAHPRNLYRDAVYLRAGGEMKFTRTWGIKGWPEHTVRHETRPLRWNLRHWLELTPRPEHEGPLTAFARYTGDNRFEITSDQVRELHVLVHPRMLDMNAPVHIVVNGTERYAGKVAPNPHTMLELVREFDDRGRIWWAKIHVEVPDDRPDPFGF